MATTAQSQEGSSLYEPFPQPNPVDRVERFVDQLKAGGGKSGTLDLSRAELERGVLVDPQSGSLEPAPAQRGGPSERAAGGEGLAPSFGWVLAAVLLAISCATTVGLSRITSRVA